MFFYIKRPLIPAEIKCYRYNNYDIRTESLIDGSYRTEKEVRVKLRLSVGESRLEKGCYFVVWHWWCVYNKAFAGSFACWCKTGLYSVGGGLVIRLEISISSWLYDWGSNFQLANLNLTPLLLEIFIIKFINLNRL